MISKLTIWNIDIQRNNEELMDNFLSFSQKINSNFILNLNKKNYCFIEKIIYDTVYFHSKRMNIDLTNKSITFWSKMSPYNFDYIHMHKDHCDYESRVFNTEIKKPLFTSLIYFSDNSSPTIITEINSTTNLNNYKLLKSKIGISFPKKYKNICFDSGNYYHGEGYLSDNINKERKVLVIALWDTNNTPYYVPYFSSELFYYYMFNEYERLINENEMNEFTKDNSIINFNNIDNNMVTIRYSGIEENFFETLLIKKEKKVLYKFFDLLKQFINLDTFIIELV